MTLAKLSLATVLVAAAVSPALAADDGTPLGAYLASLAAPSQPAATKVVEGRQTAQATAPVPTSNPAQLSDAERYLTSR